MNPGKTKILCTVPSLRRGGAETQAIDLINGLSSDLFEKHLIVFENELDQRYRLDASVIRFEHIPRRYKLDPRPAWRIARLIDDLSIDVVHCTLQIALFFGWLGCKLSHRNPPLVTAVHTTVNISRKEEIFDQLLYRRLFGRCERVIFVCQAQERHWNAKYPVLRGRSEVIYNGVDPNDYDPVAFESAGQSLRHGLAIPLDAPVVACVAGFRPEKGHRFLLDAIARLDGVHLLLAGDGPMRGEAEQRAKDRNLIDRVHFLGNLADVRPVLAASDLTVLASTAVETFSMAMLESMAMETPVVATDIGGLAEAIVPGETGNLVPPGDADALASALGAMLDDQSGLAGMGRQARMLVLKSFTKKLMVENTARILFDVAEGNDG